MEYRPTIRRICTIYPITRLLANKRMNTENSKELNTVALNNIAVQMDVMIASISKKKVDVKCVCDLEL